jgi:hypothetical protein|nr:hypothetical protein [Panacagrimonas sp.]
MNVPFYRFQNLSKRGHAVNQGGAAAVSGTTLRISDLHKRGSNGTPVAL